MPTSRTFVDTSSFNAMCQSLSKAAGTPLHEVVRAETGKILEATIRNTPALKVSRAKARFASATASAQPATLYTPKRPRKGSGKNVVYFLNNRYPNALWQAIQARRTARLAAIIRARGLAKHSWLKIASSLGIKISAAGYVASAVASTGRQYADVSATQVQSASGITIAFENAQPTANKTGGAAALQRAIDGRTKFFLNGVAKGLLSNMQNVAKAYPSLKIKP